MTAAATAKRINFTGRGKVKLEWVTASLDNSQPAPQLSVAVSLDQLDLPADSTVLVEATRGAMIERLPLGTVGALTQLVDHPLTAFQSRDGVKIAIRISSSNGKLLARSVSITPSKAEGSDGETEPLLTFRSDDSLGQIAWMLDFSSDEPIVLVNADLPGWNNVARSEAFIGLVYPEILRQIALWVLSEDDGTDDEESALMRWRAFLAQLGLSTDGVDRDNADEWAASAAQAFAGASGLRSLTWDVIAGAES